MSHTHYSLDNFLIDESFQAYAAGTDAHATQYWQQWLTEHPDKQADALKACTLLQALAPVQPRPMPAGLQEQELEHFQQALQTLSKDLTTTRR